MKGKLPILAQVGAVVGCAIVLWRGARSIGEATAGVFPHSEHLAFALVVAGGVLLPIAYLQRQNGTRPARRRFAGAALQGAAAGLAGYAIMALGVSGAAALIGLVSPSFPQEPLDGFAGLATLLVLVLLSEALPEELLFRGWLSECLRRIGGAWFAIVVQAALFTLFAAAVGAIASANDAGFIAALGIVLGMLRIVSGTVWVPVGFHLAFMTAQQSSASSWNLIVWDEPLLARVVLLTMIPFTLVVAVLFDRVKKKAPRAATMA